MKHERYVVVDTRTTCGNSVFFWCWDGQGYTCDLRMAAIFTAEEAADLERGRETDKAYRLSDVLKLVQHHVDLQDLRHVPAGVGAAGSPVHAKPPPAHPHTYSHLRASEG